MDKVSILSMIIVVTLLTSFVIYHAFIGPKPEPEKVIIDNCECSCKSVNKSKLEIELEDCQAYMRSVAFPP